MDIRRERFYPVPVQSVWHALTDPEALSEWFFEADFKPEVGYQFQFRDEPRANWDGLLYGEVLVAEEPARLVYTWKGGQMRKHTTISWELTAEAEGTVLKLAHTGFEGLFDVVVGFIHRYGWGKHLTRLDAYFASGRV